MKYKLIEIVTEILKRPLLGKMLLASEIENTFAQGRCIFFIKTRSLEESEILKNPLYHSELTKAFKLLSPEFSDKIEIFVL